MILTVRVLYLESVKRDGRVSLYVLWIWMLYVSSMSSSMSCVVICGSMLWIRMSVLVFCFVLFVCRKVARSRALLKEVF